jgi:hypothetical protein
MFPQIRTLTLRAILSICYFTNTTFGLPSPPSRNSTPHIPRSISATSSAEALDLSTLTTLNLTSVQLDTEIEYYRLTPANLAASGVIPWYKNWTINARNTPEFQAKGEFAWFVESEMGVANFDCSMNRPGPCREMPSLADLKVQFPCEEGYYKGSCEENRNHIRRLDFMKWFITDQHDLAQHREVSCVRWVERCMH